MDKSCLIMQWYSCTTWKTRDLRNLGAIRAPLQRKVLETAPAIMFREKSREIRWYVVRFGGGEDCVIGMIYWFRLVGKIHA